MKIHTLEREQILPVSLQESWDFFSNPENLSQITPNHMGFRIQYISGGKKMYAGQIIRYKIQVLPGFKSNWVTEITHVVPKEYFIDEQRFGPYALWHHQHHFKEVSEGTKMIDIVNYAIPLKVIGQLANKMFVEKEVNKIFKYRAEVIAQYFNR